MGLLALFSPNEKVLLFFLSFLPLNTAFIIATNAEKKTFLILFISYFVWCKSFIILNFTRLENIVAPIGSLQCLVLHLYRVLPNIMLLKLIFIGHV